MKSLVVYSTKTDNTKKLAYTIYDSLPGEKEISFVGDAPDPNDYDFVAVNIEFFGIKQGIALSR